MAHGQLEHLKDPEESVETDLVLTVFHARQVGLRHADSGGELRLRQVPALPDLTDLLPHEEDLGRTRHSAHEPSSSKIVSPVPGVKRFRVVWTSATSLKNKLFLLSELLRRDLAARYGGSYAGPLWAVLNPAVFCALNAYVFAFVFKSSRQRAFVAVTWNSSWPVFSPGSGSRRRS